MSCGLALAVSLTAMATVASAQEPAGLERVQRQDVIAVKCASRAQIYETATAWFAVNFDGSKDELVRNPLAGTLVGTGYEKYAPAYADGSCNFWLHYRVILGARDGRFYYSIGDFRLDTDPICPTRSFRIPMNGGVGLLAKAPLIDFSLRPPTTGDDEQQVQRDLERRAADLMDTLGRSLLAKLATAAAGRPAA